MRAESRRWILSVMVVLMGLLFTVIPSPAPATVEAGPVVNPATGSTYYLLSPGTWNDAEAEAVSLGGHLVTINDAAENAWVWSAFTGYPGPFWIGLIVDINYNFVWASGEPVAYLNWAPGQPDAFTIGVPTVMNPQWDDTLASTYRAVVEVTFGGCSLEGTWKLVGVGTASLDESGGGTISGIYYVGFPGTPLPITGTRVGGAVALSLALPPPRDPLTLMATMSECDALFLNAGSPPYIGGPGFTCLRIRSTYCGDNNVDPGETCDDGNFDNNDSCNVACEPLPPCGNGVIDPGESCDDGNPNQKDACLNSCELNTCGDGHVNIGVENCDDGNLTAGDGCAANCILEPDTVTGDISSGLVTTQGGPFYAPPIPSDPVETYVTLALPRTGAISINEQPAPPNATSGFVLLGTLIQVTATNVVPTPSATDPIYLTFRFHSSVVPAGQGASSIEVRKDGLLLDDCGNPGVSPPCVNQRLDLYDEIWIQVTTPSLSDFDFTGSVCGSAPSFGCQPALAGTAKLKLKERGGEDQLKWKWKSSQLTPASIFGDPTASNDYTLCLYDASGRRLQMTSPAAGTCAGKPCWKQTAAGFKYGDKASTADGIGKLILKSGDTGKAKLLLKARGPGLDLPTLPLTPPVMAQLRSRDGACWETYLPAVKVNDEERFDASND